MHRPTRSAERVCTLTFFSAFCQGTAFYIKLPLFQLLGHCSFNLPPHHYYTPKQVRFQFFHFDGNITSDYCEYLYQKDGALFRKKSEAALTFQQLLDQLRLPQPDDHRLSALVHTLFGLSAAKIRKPLSSSIQACLYPGNPFPGASDRGGRCPPDSSEQIPLFTGIEGRNRLLSP